MEIGIKIDDSVLRHMSRQEVEDYFREEARLLPYRAKRDQRDRKSGSYVDADGFRAQDDPSVQRIGIDPDICFGKPRVERARLAVIFLLEMIAADGDFQDVLEDYPEMDREDIVGALLYARNVVYRAFRHKYGEKYEPTHSSIDVKATLNGETITEPGMENEKR